MKDVIQVDNQWYVLATSSRADDRTRVLKEGESFALFDRHGDIHSIAGGEQGLFHEGTRFLSLSELIINEQRPLLLNSTVKQDNSLLVVDLTTPDLYEADRLVIHQGKVHIFRAKLLWQGTLYEHLRLVNYGEVIINIRLDLHFAADYADIFEVRGVRRVRRGQLLAPVKSGREWLLSYRGLDDLTRRTRIVFSENMEPKDDHGVNCVVPLTPHIEKDLYITVTCEQDAKPSTVLIYGQARDNYGKALKSAAGTAGSLYTSNEQFNDWINRSTADLQMLVSQTPQGPYPYAGVPWYSTAFGRDGIITALQYLWLDPGLARGVLGYLAATQAQEQISERDAEPGKILHETRTGEMAALGEIPFKQYYGTVDATPLFIVLAGAYYRRTDDRPFLEGIWSNIERALNWIDRYGDVDGDSFVEYARHSTTGLVQQGWKDSDDSVFHQDGSSAQAPIALCEVQGYVYAAKQAAAELANLVGETARAAELKQQAQRLKQRFNEAFWCDELGTFALALDGNKKPCRVHSSNVGHALASGIVSPKYAPRLAETLLSPESFSGWGVRTIAESQARYNPMSYHNGSIWPHDNAIVAYGLARYGFKDKALQILTGLFDTSIMMDLHRLPELFCGFSRLPGQGPTLYPVACSPQAWASGTVFFLLQSCLGLSFSPEKPQFCFHHPRLPSYIDQLQISNLRMGSTAVDLLLRRHTHDVGINVLRKEGDVEVTVVV